MADYLIHDSTLEDIADAIRAKTGGSALINPEDMAEEIASISGGGGGSLPSSISKIDGGSFTVASDTKCSTYSISTSLGVPAKYFLIWTDDLNSFGEVANKGLMSVMVKISQFEAASGTRYGYYAYGQRQPNGGTYQGATTLTYENQPPTFTDSTMIKCNISDTYYIADKTYKWVAMA